MIKFSVRFTLLLTLLIGIVVASLALSPATPLASDIQPLVSISEPVILTPSQGIDGLGRAVLFSPDESILLAGARFSSNYTGIVVVYKKNQIGQWVESQTLVDPTTNPSLSFGERLALSGNGLIFSTIARDGKIITYEYNGVNFVLQQIIDNPYYSTQFIALSHDGSIIAVSDNSEIIVFERQNGIWLVSQAIPILSLHSRVFLSPSADMLVVNTQYAGSNGNYSSSVFKRVSGQYVFHQSLLRRTSEDLAFGYISALSPNGTQYAAGYLYEPPSLTVFSQNGEQWSFADRPVGDKRMWLFGDVGFTADNNLLFGLSDYSLAPAPSYLWVFQRYGNNQWKLFGDFPLNCGTWQDSSPARQMMSVSASGRMIAIGANSPQRVCIYTFSQTPPPTPTPSFTPNPNANSVDRFGLFDQGVWNLYPVNAISDPFVTTVYGNPTDLPVTGDWNGDGVDSLGVYRPEAGQFFLSNQNYGSPATHYNFYFGNPGDIGVSGRWNSNMTHDGVGVIRPSTGEVFLKNSLNTGFGDLWMVFGNPGDRLFVGDWNNDGIDTFGLVRGDTECLSNQNTPGIVQGACSVSPKFFSNFINPPVWGIIAGRWFGREAVRGEYYRSGYFIIKDSPQPRILLSIGREVSDTALPVAGRWTAEAGFDPANRPNLWGILVPPLNGTPQALVGGGGDGAD
jgi:hypothetical protein